jgi:hypothetical protein
MRQEETGKPRHAAAEIENVAVDHARPISERGLAAAGPLDVLQRREQSAWRAAPADGGDEIEERGLPVEADGLARVERRDTADGGEAGDADEGGGEMGTAVAQVGAEAEVNGPAGAIKTLLRPRALSL